MAGINVPMNRTSGSIGGRVLRAPRLVMSWEDWLTLASLVICFVSVAISIDQARWVPAMPNTVWTLLIGLLLGMVAARLRLTAAIVQPVALAIGAVAVVLAVQTYAEGVTLSERVSDLQARMNDWFEIVRAGDISNDHLPFIVLVHLICMLTAYLGAFSIYRWHNPWVAVLPASVVILANIGFMVGQPSGAFIAFLFGAILLISRMHIQRNQQRWRRQGIEYPEFISLSAIQLTVIVTVGLLALSWAVPLGTQATAVEGIYDTVAAPFTAQNQTFARLFHNVDSQKGARLHSFGPLLPIQGHVKLGQRELYQIKSGDAGLVRATSYDNYTGNGWKAGDRETRRVNGGTLAAPQDAAAYEARTTAILQVTVLDSENTILSAGSPLATNKDATVESASGVSGEIEQIRPRRSLEKGDTYNSVGSQSTATVEQLRKAGNAYPQWVKDRDLQLPKSLPQRVRDEAKSVSAGASTPYDQAAAIEAYLRGFPYDLDVGSPSAGRDTVDYFLFDLKRGYFDYQATAMAVMLRTLGIPARVTTGYVLDPSAATETTYSVRKSDAYTWVEVFFPKLGWVNFNPTQDKPGGGAAGTFGSAGTATGVDPASLDDFLNDAGLVPEDPGGAAIQSALNEDPIEQSSPPWTLIWTLTGLAAAAAAIALAGRTTWNWGLAGLEPRARMWAKAQRLAGWSGLQTHSDETPREWSRRLGERIERDSEATTLAKAYEESRYGRPEQRQISDDQAAGSYREVRNRLFSGLLRRKRAISRRSKN